MTEKQRKALEFLWFTYGNGGNCHTNANHKFLQRHVEGRLDEAKCFEHLITEECRRAHDRVMRDDYSELTEMARKVVGSMGKESARGAPKGDK